MMGFVVLCIVAPVAVFILFWMSRKAIKGRYNKTVSCFVRDVQHLDADVYSGVFNDRKLSEFICPDVVADYLMKQNGEQKLKIHFFGKGKVGDRNHVVRIYGLETPEGNKFKPGSADLDEYNGFLVYVGAIVAAGILAIPMFILHMMFILITSPGTTSMSDGGMFVWVVIPSLVIPMTAAISYKAVMRKAKKLESVHGDLTIHTQTVL